MTVMTMTTVVTVMIVMTVMMVLMAMLLMVTQISPDPLFGKRAQTENKPRKGGGGGLDVNKMNNWHFECFGMRAYAALSLFSYPGLVNNQWLFDITDM